MQEPTTITVFGEKENNETEKQPAVKIPIFIGVNEKDKLQKILEIVNDDDVYEVVIISPETYKNLMTQYIFEKQGKERQKQIEDGLRNEQIANNMHQLALELKERGYEIFDRRILKEHFEKIRKIKISNSDADEILDVMFAFKKIEIVNIASKYYERDYKLTLTDEDMIQAKKMLLSGIKEQISTLKKHYEAEKAVVKKMEDNKKQKEKAGNDIDNAKQHTESQSPDIQ